MDKRILKHFGTFGSIRDMMQMERRAADIEFLSFLLTVVVNKGSG